MKYILTLLLFLSCNLFATESDYGVGITIVDISKRDKEYPYKIVIIQKGSEAEIKGLKPNDIILSTHKLDGSIIQESANCSFKELLESIIGPKYSKFKLKIFNKKTDKIKTIILKRTYNIKQYRTNGSN